MFILVAILAAGLSQGASTTISGPVTIVDGDTIRLGPVPVRIHGIDAPEDGQMCHKPSGGTWPCGKEATNHLAKLIENSEVTCEALDRDAYGRVIGRCLAGDVDVALGMVQAGLAWAYLEYSGDYAAEEILSRESGVGIWSADNQPPWDYRADRWNRAAAESPREGCPIKGNINRSGERIYHTPWSPAYTRTLIDESQGERWFCDEAEARAAGWRAARWR